ncbi:MAG TPA: DsrE family protein [Cytophagales bacterium]|jgi:hypothetical protein
MKKLLIRAGMAGTFCLLAGHFLAAYAQDHDLTAYRQGAFHGAKADKPFYYAIYQLDSADPKLIAQTLSNMRNAMQDTRLKGKLRLELIAFSDGVAVYQKDHPYEKELLALRENGVILAQCNNTLQERKIAKETLFPFVAIVPSGNGELIIRQAQGWSLVHP